MEYKELIERIKEIPEDNRIISLKYKVSNDFGIHKNGSVYYLTIKKGHNNQSNDAIYKSIINSVNGVERGAPRLLQLGFEQSLEMLYHHYPYGYDNNSNCVLYNTSNRIVGIQYNNLKKTTYLQTDCVVVPDYIVINNKKKLEGVYKVKEYNNLLPLLKKICVE